MPFVSRDNEGNINAVSAQARKGCGEPLEYDDKELKDYLKSLVVKRELGSLDADTEAELVRSDLDLVRVVEDLINVLIEKNIICFTDLPYIAQKKINRRRNIRFAINGEDGLLDDDESLI